MPVIISLLCAVNVGGRNQVRMQDLKAAYASLGLEDVRTYIQSGNVVFRTAARDLNALQERIEDAIECTCHVRTIAILRTVQEWRGVVAANPMTARPELHPSKLLVMFFVSEPAAADQQRLLDSIPGNEEVHFSGREAFFYFPDGMGRSKLPPLAARILKTRGTGRNWNTVLKLLEIAEQIVDS